MEIKQAKQERRRSERRWRRSQLTVDRQIYCHHKNRVSRLVRDAKRDYVCQKISGSQSSAELFRLASEMMGSGGGSALPGKISAEQLPDKFNSYFIEKICNIRNTFDSNFPTDTIEFSGCPLSTFKPVTCLDVRKTIFSMPKKSCSLDPLPSDLLYSCLDCVLPTITDIMNDSLATGFVPSSFKHAVVKPLLKKANLDPEILKNYRPVSNLPFLSKVLERIVLSQLLQHLESNHLLEPFQSAYRKSHSTETALLCIFDRLLKAADKGEVTLLSLLDLSAAFDTIDHGILLTRLSKCYGCAGTVLEWFRSYLSQRTQSVSVGSSISASSALTCGVPQGSVLGPVLFTMYTMPLGSIISQFNTSYHFFADDTQLYLSSAPELFSDMADRMRACIEDVAEWMHGNRLKMNDDKTEVLLTGSKSNLAKVNVSSVSFLSCDVPLSRSARNLGVHFDVSLSMDVHIGHLRKALYLQLRKISKIRPFLSVSATNKLCVSLVLSRLDYCNSLFAGLSEGRLLKLQAIQNSAARLVLQKGKRSNSSSHFLLKKLHWLPVRARVDYKMAVLCFTCLNCECMPSYLSSLLVSYEPSRSLRSQDAALLTVPRYSLESFGRRSFSVFAPSLWNSLPLSLRQLSTLDSFKKHLKTYLFSKYFP